MSRIASRTSPKRHTAGTAQRDFTTNQRTNSNKKVGRTAVSWKKASAANTTRSTVKTNRYAAQRKNWLQGIHIVPKSKNLYSGFMLLAGTLLGLMLFFACSIGLVYGYRYLTVSPYFSLRNIEIHGNSRLTFREILEIANIKEESNSLAVSLDELEGRLMRNPWILDVSVKRNLPDGLRIDIKEREPRFWVLKDSTLHYADREGSLIATVGVDAFSPFPTLDVEPGAEHALDYLPELIKKLGQANLPIDMKTVSWMKLSPARGVEIYMENNRCKISIGLESWESNLQNITLALADLSKRGELDKVREISALGQNVWVAQGT